MPPAHPSSPGYGDRDVDAAFEDIVARWGDDAVEPDRPRRTAPTPAPDADPTERAEHQEGPPRGERPPTTEPRPAQPESHEPAPARRPSGIVVPPVPTEGRPQVHFGVRGYSPAQEPEESFVPPAPAPVPAPQKDPVFWVVIGCLAAGPLLVVVLVLTGRTSMSWLLTLGVVATIVGFVLLVARGRTPRDQDDDGARV